MSRGTPGDPRQVAKGQSEASLEDYMDSMARPSRPLPTGTGPQGPPYRAFGVGRAAARYGRTGSAVAHDVAREGPFLEKSSGARGYALARVLSAGRCEAEKKWEGCQSGTLANLDSRRRARGRCAGNRLAAGKRTIPPCNCSNDQYPGSCVVSGYRPGCLSARLRGTANPATCANGIAADVAQWVLVFNSSSIQYWAAQPPSCASGCVLSPGPTALNPPACTPHDVKTRQLRFGELAMAGGARPGCTSTLVNQAWFRGVVRSLASPRQLWALLAPKHTEMIVRKAIFL
ncbi:hypothetical protein OH77DRAFT_1172064 [Trametes cingulata]|nr:hypothetical protein OH77DRAFT_1172064 [Trametes cingulata]